ncbi:MAG: hypothetical protein KatS3mg068_0126 [Candidatus Sericytochromatia bacterium]|nr:MAG: hypothetical protein KatS3mg068_0126 [Candidatus Sericytochromatia bacterium]
MRVISDSLAWGILQILYNDNYANYLRENAYKKVVNVFNWDIIAKDTSNVYNYLLSR